MNEEEKEAIDNLKFCCTKAEQITRYDGSCEILKVYDIQTVLNLIEKQSKEIDELKKIHKEFLKLHQKLKAESTLLSAENILNAIHKNYVSKDKTRNLLKQVNASLYHFKDSEKNNIIQRIKDRLEELLEESE